MDYSAQCLGSSLSLAPSLLCVLWPVAHLLCAIVSELYLGDNGGSHALRLLVGQKDRLHQRSDS